ncbi:hypothetical protein TRVL_06821 [Trypanosoma vivax]|nr:hypothetical protein TRVL_06821 [Trypanosoma vivax]
MENRPVLNLARKRAILAPQWPEKLRLSVAKLEAYLPFGRANKFLFKIAARPASNSNDPTALGIPSGAKFSNREATQPTPAKHQTTHRTPKLTEMRRQIAKGKKPSPTAL